MILGAHESSAGGLFQAFARAEASGAECVQIFTKSNRAWAARDLDPDETERFRAEGARAGMLATGAVHASYLINLGAEPEAPAGLFEKSVAALADELRRAAALGVPRLVLHPGSCADPDVGVRRIAVGIERAFELAAAPAAGAAGRSSGGGAPEECRLVLETAAGQGAAVGRRFEELAAIRAAVSLEARRRVTYCLDTCHVFAAGYDLSTPAGYEEVVASFDRLLGLGLLDCIHLNDSLKPLGCNVDRHERPGHGCLGPEPFSRMLADPRLAEVPAYLELPPEENRECLLELRALAKRAPRAKRPASKKTAKPAASRSRVARRPPRG